MGEKLPVLSGREVISILVHAGFQVKRQTGSHVHLIGINKQTQQRTLVTVPVHGSKEVLPKTLLSILRQAGIARDDFQRLVDN
ncbi:type II toxin-antitoxin system HicA family toxin [Candidatus Woesearchaeota archaeon]|nr:type II toxin-antitoxin system HicA family toxin [Candidatus Woesearchaeota archaeon]